MGEIASYYLMENGRKTTKCTCHVCGMTFDNKAGIRQHFISSQNHYRLKKLLKQKNLEDFFHEEEVIKNEPDVNKGSSQVSELRRSNIYPPH